ncbi:MAG: hypothetical protein ACKPCP_22695 [Sphaerospermopsis kisseleviana]
MKLQEHSNYTMKKREEPKLVISISLEVEHYQSLQDMARERNLFIKNGSKKGEPNISGLIKQIAEEKKTKENKMESCKRDFQIVSALLNNLKNQENMENYIQESPVCEYAKEIFTAMVKIAEDRGLRFSNQDHIERLIREAVDICKLTFEFLQDEELYRGDIHHLINNRPD